MATRSHIGILNENGTVDYIYCHFDGYLDHNGRILNQHYTTEDQVRQLLALGDLSILGPELGEKHIFHMPANKNWCKAYGRDRGETNVDSRNIPYEVYSNKEMEDYTYLFTPGKGWEFRTYGRSGWSNLSEALNTTTVEG